MTVAEAPRSVYVDPSTPIEFRGRMQVGYIIPPRALEVTLLKAQGFHEREIVGLLKISVQTVKNEITSARQRLNTETLGVIVYAIETGQIDPAALTSEFDYNRLSDLTPIEREIFVEAIAPQNWDQAIKELAPQRRISEQAYKNSLTGIYKKLGLRNMIHMRVYGYFMSEEVRSGVVQRLEPVQVFPSPLTDREKDVINLKAMGLTHKETAFRLKISEQTVKNHVSAAFRKRGKTDSFSVITELVQAGDLNSEELSEGFEFERYLTLTDRERAIVDRLGRPEAWQLGRKKFAHDMNMSESTMKNHLSIILKRLDLPNALRVAVFRLLLPQEIQARVPKKPDWPILLDIRFLDELNEQERRIFNLIRDSNKNRTIGNMARELGLHTNTFLSRVRRMSAVIGVDSVDEIRRLELI